MLTGKQKTNSEIAVEEWQLRLYFISFRYFCLHNFSFFEEEHRYLPELHLDFSLEKTNLDFFLTCTIFLCWQMIQERSNILFFYKNNFVRKPWPEGEFWKSVSNKWTRGTNAEYSLQNNNIQNIFIYVFSYHINICRDV